MVVFIILLFEIHYGKWRCRLIWGYIIPSTYKDMYLLKVYNIKYSLRIEVFVVCDLLDFKIVPFSGDHPC